MTQTNFIEIEASLDIPYMTQTNFIETEASLVIPGKKNPLS